MADIPAPLAGAAPSVAAGGAVPVTLRDVPPPAPSPAADVAYPTFQHEGLGDLGLLGKVGVQRDHLEVGFRAETSIAIAIDKGDTNHTCG